MIIDRPWLLLLFLALPITLWIVGTSIVQLSPRRTVLTTLLRLLGLTTIILALAGFSIGRDLTPSTVFVVDTSSSVLLSEHANSSELIDAYVQAFGSETAIGIVQFGAATAVLAAPQHLTTAPVLRTDLPAHSTDYESSLLTALGLIDPEAGGQIILLSDGTGSKLQLNAAAQTALARGVPISVIPAQANRPADLVLKWMEVQPTARPSTNLNASVRIVSKRETTARLRIWDENRLIRDGSIVIAPGARTYGINLSSLEPGFHRLRAELLDDTDSRLNNNVAEAFVKVSAPSQVLIVGEAQHITNALAAAGIEVREISPSEMVNTDLTAFETIVLSDVPATAIGRSDLHALRTHVAGGRGLVVLGGPASFAAGSYSNTPLEDALPVWSDPTDQGIDPRLALVLIIDRSTSMNQGASEGNAKIDLAIEAAVDAVALLNEGDIIGVMAFDMNAQWVVPPRLLTSITDVKPIIDRIRGIQIGTSTDLYRAMFLARSRLGQVDASIKHVVLLTDGRANYGDFASLTRSMRRRSITVSTIAIGVNSDRVLLEQIARLGNGRHYFVLDPRSIPRILTRETRTAKEFAIVERRFQPQLNAPSPIFGGDLAGQVLPELSGFVRTRAKPTAEIVLSSDRNEPILAQWQYGRGRSVAWMSDSGSRWAADWTAWDSFPAFVRQTVEWASPPPDTVQVPIIVRVETSYADDEAVVEIDTVDADHQFVNGLTTHLTLIAASGSTRDLPAMQIAPGRYQTRIRGLSSGVYEIGVEQRNTDGLVSTGSWGLVIPVPDELRHITTNRRELQRIAALTGGVAIASAKDLMSLPTHINQSLHFGWHHLLTIALIAFVTDVGVRRLLDNPRRLRSRIGERVRSSRGAVKPLQNIRWPFTQPR